MCTRLPHIGLTAVAIVYTGSTKLLYLGVFYEVRDRIHMKPNVPVLGATPIKIALSESMQHRWTDSHDILCQRTIKILSTHIFYLDASIIMTTLQKKNTCVSVRMRVCIHVVRSSYHGRLERSCWDTKYQTSSIVTGGTGRRYETLVKKKAWQRTWLLRKTQDAISIICNKGFTIGTR